MHTKVDTSLALGSHAITPALSTKIGLGPSASPVSVHTLRTPNARRSPIRMKQRLGRRRDYPVSSYDLGTPIPSMPPRAAYGIWMSEVPLSPRRERREIRFDVCGSLGIVLALLRRYAALQADFWGWRSPTTVTFKLSQRPKIKHEPIVSFPSPMLLTLTRLLQKIL